jgi:hypothetical protein
VWAGGRDGWACLLRVRSVGVGVWVCEVKRGAEEGGGAKDSEEGFGREGLLDGLDGVCL